jgi:hypothetical protein
MVEVILVEASLSESALACIAIALRRPGTRVAETRSLEQAADLVEKQGRAPALVILGWDALQRSLNAFVDSVGGNAAVVGLASDVGRASRERALRAGVRAIYERPADWKEYAAALAGLLDEWSLAGKDA